MSLCAVAPPATPLLLKSTLHALLLSRNRETDEQTNLSLYTISALLILDSDGARVLAKYYTPPHQASIGTGLVADLGVGAGGPGMGLSGLKEQKAFEKSIWEKVKRGGGESCLVLSFSSLAGHPPIERTFTNST